MVERKRAGRKAVRSGGFEIANARQLFEQSVQRGTPDFRYIALAIGGAPLEPPMWAIWECIGEKERTEVLAASAVDKMNVILDDLVRFYAREQREKETSTDAVARDAGLPNLTAAVRRMCALTKRREDELDHKANTDWMRDIRNAWKREQKTDPVVSHVQLRGWVTTNRINRVLMEEYGREFDMPADPHKALWQAEQLQKIEATPSDL